MAMESVLKELESRIETLVEAYRSARSRGAELEAKVAGLETEKAELEAKLSGSSEASDRVAELERQRDQLAGRLEKVLGLIDGVLEDGVVSD
jgi:chromosome segregation ATPase